jgi:hypothetical protein
LGILVPGFKFWGQNSNSGQICYHVGGSIEGSLSFLQNRHCGEEREREKRESARAREREDRETDRQTDRQTETRDRQSKGRERARGLGCPWLQTFAQRAPALCTHMTVHSAHRPALAHAERESARARERESARARGPQYGGAQFGFHGPRRSPGTCRTCRTYRSASLLCHPSAPICFTAYCSSAPPSLTRSLAPSLPRS